MKKILCLSLLLMTGCFVANAQVKKGLIYPDISFSKYIRNYNTHGVRGSVAYGLNNHSTVGIYSSFTYFKPNPVTKSSLFISETEVGISYNYLRYIGKRQKWGWSLTADLGLLSRKFIDKSVSPSYSFRDNYLKLYVAPGVFYKANDKLTFFGNIGGGGVEYGRQNGTWLRSDLLNKVSLGFRFSFGKQNKK